MAYDGAKLSLIDQGIGSGATRTFQYRSTDAIATVNTAGYISDATARGLRVRDIVIVDDTNVPSRNTCIVIAVTAGAADLSDGTVTAETNSD